MSVRLFFARCMAFGVGAGWMAEGAAMGRPVGSVGKAKAWIEGTKGYITGYGTRTGEMGEMGLNMGASG